METESTVEDHVKDEGGELNRWVARTAICCAVLIGLGMFAISFTALRDLAVRGGISAHLGWVWAVCIDGIIAASTLALVALAKHSARVKTLPWVLIVSGGAVSVAGNIFDAQIHAQAGFASFMVVIISAAPPLGLLALTQLVVVLSRRTPDARVHPIQAQQALAVSETPLPAKRSGERLSPITPDPAFEAAISLECDDHPQVEQVETPPKSVSKAPLVSGYKEAGVWVLQQPAHGEELTGTEVAERFGCSPSTARRWLRKTREERQEEVNGDSNPIRTHSLRAADS